MRPVQYGVFLSRVILAIGYQYSLCLIPLGVDTFGLLKHGVMQSNQ